MLIPTTMPLKAVARKMPDREACICVACGERIENPGTAFAVYTSRIGSGEYAWYTFCDILCITGGVRVGSC